ncbi:hypothetical protein EDB89DRAFT_2163701 [Lactarius sanguifluus]|nr:hypothetical protein EDB89DRAFT_2163701 [Lactarius sanguifluus]
MNTLSHWPGPVSLLSLAELFLSASSPGCASVRVCPFSLLDDPSSGSAPHIGRIAQGRRRKQENVRAQGESYAATISMVPDNVLLEIFDFYRKTHNPLRLVWKWHLLVHVCQKWRQIVFASPHRLNLQILCTYGNPLRKNLAVWPAFPIVIDYRHSGSGITPNDEDDVIAALEQPNRVCDLRLAVTGSISNTTQV